MASMLFANVLYAKVGNDKGKQDRSPFVPPKALGVSALFIAMRCQSLSEKLIGYFAGLR
jgi:hypothetical protein